jgi:hypothetical protein
VPHVVEDNLSLSPICDCSGEAMNMGTYVPRLEHDKLIFELSTPIEKEIIIDIDRTNEWGTVETANDTNYIWEYMDE